MGLYYLYSENKGAGQLRSYCAADLRLCFRICKSRFSHNEAHLNQRLLKVQRAVATVGVGVEARHSTATQMGTLWA